MKNCSIRSNMDLNRVIYFIYFTNNHRSKKKNEFNLLPKTIYNNERTET